MAKGDVRTGPEDITAAAHTSFDACDDGRLRELMQALVRHLHDLAREVRLTQQEWVAALDVLVETGRMTQGGRNEFVLWSDTLGLSMLVDALANPKPPGATESTIMGRSGRPAHRSAGTARRSSTARPASRRSFTAGC